ncbi:PREDICTED: uncharacterized protein LOC104596959 isoform X3 [Nelumbo nucifera]|uniref:Uncharacterized protein LOC104596959 isoform X3 n=1 Tax=Nelumbo nucifera TaxID=4432 RepID=A0A1U8A5F7_NELNU|nr:PREDICTED: uncharacterized protein LOC104596959 isoform X3 [Nelumbo nucifera]
MSNSIRAYGYSRSPAQTAESHQRLIQSNADNCPSSQLLFMRTAPKFTHSPFLLSTCSLSSTEFGIQKFSGVDDPFGSHTVRRRSAMPPRRRNKKVGLKRMDAAVDALFQMGFSKSLVRNTVKNLLKVYGGDDGWPFIEEGSYKLVLDTILEEQEKQWVVVQKDESLKDAEAELVSIEPQCVMQVGIVIFLDE